MNFRIEYFSSSTSGEIITQLDEDVPVLFHYYYILFFKLAGSSLALIGIIISLITRSGCLCAVLFLVSMLLILGFKWIHDRGIPKYVCNSAATTMFNRKMKEILDNAITLRAISTDGFIEERMTVVICVMLWDADAISISTTYLIYTYSEIIIEPLQDFRNHMGNID